MAHVARNNVEADIIGVGTFRTVATLRLNAALISCGVTALDHTLDEASL
jgi:hypothetical protein